MWNMNSKANNWTVLGTDPLLADADIFLLCEAPPWDGLLPEGVRAMGHGSTKGIGCTCEGTACRNRAYSTAIASRHPLKDMPERTRTDTYYGKPLPFEPSRPGTWTAARVKLGQLEVTAIALYGLNDEAYDSSLHRSLSELSPVFDRKHLRRHLVLGGDFNILPKPSPTGRLGRGQVVMERIRSYGLLDCVQEARPPGAGGEAAFCTCSLGEGCTHTRTFFDRRNPLVPYQDDYLFASRALVGNHRLKSCTVPLVHADSPSDHAPIVAMFDVPTEPRMTGLARAS